LFALANNSMAINGTSRRLPQILEYCSPRRIYAVFLLRLPLASVRAY
jgi:hypothetical protein